MDGQFTAQSHRAFHLGEATVAVATHVDAVERSAARMAMGMMTDLDALLDIWEARGFPSPAALFGRQPAAPARRSRRPVGCRRAPTIVAR